MDKVILRVSGPLPGGMPVSCSLKAGLVNQPSEVSDTSPGPGPRPARSMRQPSNDWRCWCEAQWQCWKLSYLM